VTGRIPNAAATIKDKENKLMRSDLIFGALAHVRNRYELCQLAAKATRKLHKPTTRLQDTANEVLVRFHDSNPMSSNTNSGSAFSSIAQSSIAQSLVDDQAASIPQRRAA
jgi:hypothetical protein